MNRERVAIGWLVGGVSSLTVSGEDNERLIGCQPVQLRWREREREREHGDRMGVNLPRDGWWKESVLAYACVSEGQRIRGNTWGWLGGTDGRGCRGKGDRLQKVKKMASLSLQGGGDVCWAA